MCIVGDDELLHELHAIVGKVRAALPPGSRQALEAAPLVPTALTHRQS